MINAQPMVLNSVEKLYSDNVGSLVQCGGKIGINLGLNFIIERNKYGDNIKLEIPEIRGLRIYFPDVKKSYMHEFEAVRLLDGKIVLVETKKDILSKFLLHYFTFDELGKDVNFGIDKIDKIIKRYFDSIL